MGTYLRGIMQDDRKTITGAPTTPPPVPAFQAVVDCSSGDEKETAEQAAKRIFFEMQEMERADIQADYERNRPIAERELEELQQAVRDFLELPVTSNRRRLAELVGITMIEPSAPSASL